LTSTSPHDVELDGGVDSIADLDPGLVIFDESSSS
jgi:hypothetical protein